MTLPGMPMAVGDPGVFVCGPADIAPWERDTPNAESRVRVMAPARRTWLVLNACLDCNPRTGVYCRNHNANNWWLTQWGRQETRPARRG